MKHDWLRNPNGTVRIVYEQDASPYCFYIRCARCDNDYCDNGCDGDVMNEECESQQESLF